MTKRLTMLDRAYELADSGECGDVLALRARLAREGYPHRSLAGRRVVAELSRRCRITGGGERAAESPLAY